MLMVTESQAVANGLRMAAGNGGFDHGSAGGGHILRRARISLQPEEPSAAAGDESTGIREDLGSRVEDTRSDQSASTLPPPSRLHGPTMESAGR